MIRSSVGPPRGILRPRTGAGKFDLARHAPAADIAHRVEHFWLVSWDLRGQEPYRSETLPHPSVHLVFERGRTEIVGVMRGKFSRILKDRGGVFGVKFRPGGFFGFAPGAVARFTDRRVFATEIFGDGVLECEQKLFATTDESERLALVEHFLREHLPPANATATFAGRIVERIMAEPDILRVEDLAERVETHPRSLQRLFRKYVGVSPAWVIKRYRLHEALERLADGQPMRWSDFALDLGYSDQAHFIRDFKNMIGVTPEQYLKAAAGV